jgi:hypothetical protein
MNSSRSISPFAYLLLRISIGISSLKKCIAFPEIALTRKMIPKATNSAEKSCAKLNIEDRLSLLHYLKSI